MKKAIKIFLGIVGLFILIGLFIPKSHNSDAGATSSNPIDEAIHDQANEEMSHIENQVAKDAEEQYNIALRQGDKMQIAVQASMVAQAYLQAKDEANYKKWKDIEKKANKEAGLDMP